MSVRATATGRGGSGTFALHAPAPIDTGPFTHLQLDVSAPNASASFSLKAFLCFSDDCASPGPEAPLDNYAPPAAPCTVPAGWDRNPGAARVLIPLGDLLPAAGGGGLLLHRLQVRGDTGLVWGLDNIALV